MRASLLHQFQGPGSMGQTMGQEQCRMLAIVRESGAEGKEAHRPGGKGAHGVGPRKEMGKDIVTQLSLRNASARCIYLTSKVLGRDPSVVRILL